MREEDDDLFIVMPSYNEESNIESVIREWYPIIEKHNGDGKSRLVIVNDGSADRTSAICHKLEAEMPLLCVIDKENSGHGATLLYAYNYAVEKNVNYIFQTDSDGQTKADEFEMFWEERDKYDALIGWRNHREDGCDRVFVTKVLKFVLWICFGVSVTDANTPFRLMSRQVLIKYLDRIPTDYNLTNVLLSVFFAYYGDKVKYIPITFRTRQGGINSINFSKIVKIGTKAIKDFRTIRKDMKRNDK